MAPARFGGRNWTIISALLLLIPTVLVIAVMHPGTSFLTFVIVAALGGLGGGNFAASMVNINAFFPEGRKSWALGLNASGGNIGVPVVQLLGLAVMGGLLVNLAFRQSFLTTKLGIPAFWAFLIFYAACILVTSVSTSAGHPSPQPLSGRVRPTPRCDEQCDGTAKQHGNTVFTKRAHDVIKADRW
jgi:nitrate/nitrite transporter NarK